MGAPHRCVFALSWDLSTLIRWVWVFSPHPSLFSLSGCAHLSRDMAHTSSLASLWILHHRFGGGWTLVSGPASKNSSCSISLVYSNQAGILRAVGFYNVHVTSGLFFSFCSLSSLLPDASTESILCSKKHFLTLLLSAHLLFFLLWGVR